MREQASIKNSLILSSVIDFFLLVLAFSIPLFPFLLPVLIIILFVLTAYKAYKTNIKVNLKTFIFLTSPFIFYCLGCFYSTNFSVAFLDVQMKLSQLAFPLSLLWISPLKTIKLKQILNYFCLGLTTAVIICLVRSFVNYFQTDDPEMFFYKQFSFIIHPSYFALYLNFGLIYLLLLRNHTYLMKNILWWFGLISLITGVFLCSSKIGLASCSVIILIFAFTSSFKKYSILTAFLIIMLLSVVIVSVIAYVPSISNRVKGFTEQFTSSGMDKTSVESNAVRILVWNSSINLIAKNPVLGVGTGDVKEELVKQYHQDGLTGAAEHRLNAHNQFLQTYVAIGLAGILSLLFIFSIAIKKCLRWRNWLYLSFLILIIVNFCVESMLETQAGVVFFSFFNTLLFLHLRNRFYLQNDTIFPSTR